MARTDPMKAASDVPAEMYINATMASIALSLFLYAIGRKQAAVFVGLWAPTIVNLGLFMKLLGRR